MNATLIAGTYAPLGVPKNKWARLKAHHLEVDQVIKEGEAYVFIAVLKNRSSTVAGVDTLVCYVGVSPKGLKPVRRVGLRLASGNGHIGYLGDMGVGPNDFDFFYLCSCESGAVACLAETGFILAFGTWRDVTGTWGLNIALGAGAGEISAQTCK